MPFDAFMTAALTSELKNVLVGLKVDKVCQPERDEIDLVFHFQGRNRLIVNCTASTPYMALSSHAKENPSVPPMLCMLLRKHLSRAKITSVEQLGFDRIIRITFDSGDEMGFRKTKSLYCEMMGRGSNLIFCDENDIILSAFRQNDITTKFDRVIMVGMPYTAMPPQDKICPMDCDRERFFATLKEMPSDTRCDLLLQKHFSGFGKLTAREIVFRAAGDPEALLSSVSLESLWNSFRSLVKEVGFEAFCPTLIYESKESFESGESPIDFSFTEIKQFSEPFYVHSCQSVSEAIETFYLQRDKRERHKQHYNDIAQILKNCKNRLEKKISAQLLQLEEADGAEEKKRWGDLIMQELYRIKKGDAYLFATDYETMSQVKIPLETMLSPSQNAQKYYREYSKMKTAQLKVREQIEIAEKELVYAESVCASLETATTALDLAQIREELSHWSYGRRLTSGLKKPQRRETRAKPMQGLTKNGFTFYIGMNNLQNDTVSTQLAEESDLWFHVKNYHGSHVLLKAKRDVSFEPSDLEEVASYAAYYSQVRESDRVEVDYTRAKFLKKPNGSKPGFVTYKNHNTAIVKPQKFK